MDLSERPTSAFRRHPWEVCRARFFEQVVLDASLASATPRILDIGAGDGYLAANLAARLPSGSEIVCFDALYGEQDLASFTAQAPAGVSFTREPPTGSFDALLLLDVAEHVPDDRGFLRELLTRNLRPGGKLVFSVPAWQGLFSRHDEALKHYRRYAPRAARALLEEVGLRIERSGGLFHSLLLPRLIEVARERLFGPPSAPPKLAGAWTAGPRLSSAVETALAADNGMSRIAARLGWPLPGLSYWALCTWPGA